MDRWWQRSPPPPPLPLLLPSPLLLLLLISIRVFSLSFSRLGGPDGVCHGDRNGNTGKGCDCGGTAVSCGEYIFDHRNGSQLTTWLTDSYIGGKKYGLGNPNVDGFFLDVRTPPTRPPSSAGMPLQLRTSQV